MYKVEFENFTGKYQVWVKENQTILEALLENGVIGLVYQCKKGICNTCLMQFQQGDVLYCTDTDTNATSKENKGVKIKMTALLEDTLLACQCYCLSDLKISQ